MTTTITPDRRNEPQAEPCALHAIAAVVIVSAKVPEGVEPRHLVDYVSAHLENRDHGLHDDIVDELTRQPMQVVGHAIRPALASVLFPARGTEAMEEMLDAAESPAKAVAS